MITYKNAFRLALVLTIIVTSYLVFSKPNYPQTFANMDKVGHLGSFFVLTYLAHFAFRPKWYALFGALAGYAVFIEAVQSRLPYRSASVGDVIADFSGVALFYLLHFAFVKYKALRNKQKVSDENNQ